MGAVHCPALWELFTGRHEGPIWSHRRGIAHTGCAGHRHPIALNAANNWHEWAWNFHRTKAVRMERGSEVKWVLSEEREVWSGSEVNVFVERMRCDLREMRGRCDQGVKWMFSWREWGVIWERWEGGVIREWSECFREENGMWSERWEGGVIREWSERLSEMKKVGEYSE